MNLIWSNSAGKVITRARAHCVLQTSGYHRISRAWVANQSARKWIFTGLVYTKSYIRTWRLRVQIKAKTSAKMRADWLVKNRFLSTQGLYFLLTDLKSEISFISSLLHGYIYNINGSEYTRKPFKCFSFCQNVTVYAYVRVRSLAKPPVSFMKLILHSLAKQ